jgi:uncharacterized membrane protein
VSNLIAVAYGGRVIHSSLSDETEEHLREALSVPAAR